MSLQPRHPLEPQLHHELRDALNGELGNTNFFVWIDVRPHADQPSFAKLPEIVRKTETWLASLHPDDINPERLPGISVDDPAADVKLRAIPKKPSARSYRSDQIVGNPEPALAGWIG